MTPLDGPATVLIHGLFVNVYYSPEMSLDHFLNSIFHSLIVYRPMTLCAMYIKIILVSPNSLSLKLQNSMQIAFFKSSAYALLIPHVKLNLLSTALHVMFSVFPNHIIRYPVSLAKKNLQFLNFSNSFLSFSSYIH